MISFSTFYLIVAAALLAFLLVYAALLIVAAVCAPGVGAVAPEGNTPPVTVLIPAHNEEEGLTACVESVLAQNYAGALQIHVLLNDASDNALPFLAKRFACKIQPHKAAQVIHASGDRSVVVKFGGVAAKREKLNAALPEVTSELVAFLDADHRADANWLCTSAALLEQGQAAAVQGSRAPLSLRKLAQLWDSAQNHAGNELLNRCYGTAGLSAYFTGTTCVFRTSELRGKTFGESLTEDTHLSYDLILSGKQIVHNAFAGSHEEVAPEFSSYIARRRRWANGHTRVFLSNAFKILAAPLPLRQRAALFVHGMFYLTPLAAACVFFLQGLYAFLQLTSGLKVYVLLAAFLIGIMCWGLLMRRFRSAPADITMLSFWIFPQVALQCVWVLYLTGQELYYFIISPPYTEYFVYAQIACLAAPLCILLICCVRTRLFRPGQLALLLVSYPLLLFIDICAYLAGAADLITGRKQWTKVSRTFEDDVLTQPRPPRLRYALYATGWAAIGALLFCAVNDLTLVPNCGKPAGLIVEPLLFERPSKVYWDVELRKNASGADGVLVTAVHTLRSESGSDVMLREWFNGTPLPEVNTRNRLAFENSIAEVPAGWQSHLYRAALRGDDFACSRKLRFTSTLKEVRGKELYVNGEPLLLKGIVASFSGAGTNLDLARGFNQIKSTGANAVRIYHAPTEAMKLALAEEHLLLVDQPDGSTWRNVDITRAKARKQLAGRFTELLHETRGNPFVLLHNAGNELELTAGRLGISAVYELLRAIEKRQFRDLYSYSSYFVFLNYPAPVLGINMLDSGATYWKSALDLITRFPKPFYASEYGGFVAFHEKTPDLLRMHRLVSQWELLRAHNAVGAIFFQSHDNWAQPVPQSYNDPFQADQPDDLRGAWDRDNNPKPEKKVLEYIFGDISARVLGQSAGKSFDIEFTNRRPYALRQVNLKTAGGLHIAGPVDFSPKQSRRISAELPDSAENFFTLNAEYVTHRGLRGRSALQLAAPLRSDRPVIYNPDFVLLKTEQGALQGMLLSSRSLDIDVPSAWEIKFDDFHRQLTPGRQTLQIPPQFEQLGAIERRAADGSWRKVDASRIGDGRYELRIELTVPASASRTLILAGLGAAQVGIRTSEQNPWLTKNCHEYRENLFDLSAFIKPGEKPRYLYLDLNRTRTVYITAADNPFKQVIPVTFEHPKIFRDSPLIIQPSAPR